MNLIGLNLLLNLEFYFIAKICVAHELKYNLFLTIRRKNIIYLYFT